MKCSLWDLCTYHWVVQQRMVQGKLVVVQVLLPGDKETNAQRSPEQHSNVCQTAMHAWTGIWTGLEPGGSSLFRQLGLGLIG